MLQIVCKHSCRPVFTCCHFPRGCFALEGVKQRQSRNRLGDFDSGIPGRQRRPLNCRGMGSNTGGQGLLVVAGPDAPELEVLKTLPKELRVVKIGNTPEDLSGLLGPDAQKCDHWLQDLVIRGCTY